MVINHLLNGMILQVHPGKWTIMEPKVMELPREFPQMVGLAREYPKMPKKNQV